MAKQRSALGSIGMIRFHLRDSDFIWLLHNCCRAPRRCVAWSGDGATFSGKSIYARAVPGRPESCFLQRRIVIYIWTRERRVRPKVRGHINTFYRSRAPRKFRPYCRSPMLPRNISSRSVDGRAFGSSSLPSSRPKLPHALYEIDELRKKYFIRERAHARGMLYAACGSIARGDIWGRRRAEEHVSASFCSLTGSRVSHGPRAGNDVRWGKTQWLGCS